MKANSLSSISRIINQINGQERNSHKIFDLMLVIEVLDPTVLFLSNPIRHDRFKLVFSAFTLSAIE